MSTLTSKTTHQHEWTGTIRELAELLTPGPNPSVHLYGQPLMRKPKLTAYLGDVNGPSTRDISPDVLITLRWTTELPHPNPDHAAATQAETADAGAAQEGSTNVAT